MPKKIKASDEDALAAHFMASLAQANSSIIDIIEDGWTRDEMDNAIIGLATAHILTAARTLMVIGISAEDACVTVTTLCAGPLAELLNEWKARKDA